MEPLTIRSKLVEADWIALLTAAGDRAQKRPARNQWLSRAAPVLTWLIVVGGLVFMFSTEPPLVRPIGLFILLIPTCLLWWRVSRIRMAQAGPDEKGCFLGEQQFDFSAEGFRVRRENCDTMNRWPLVREVTEGEQHLFLWIDRYSAYLLPARDLPPGMTLADLADRLRAFMSADAHRADPAHVVPANEPALTVPEAPAPGVPRPGTVVLPSIWQELGALARLGTLAKVDRAHLYGRELTLLVLGTLTLSLWIGLDWLEKSGDLAFAWWNTASISVAFVGVLLLAWLLARFSKPRLALRQGMLLVLGIGPLFMVAAWAVDRFPHVAVYILMGILAIEALYFLGRGVRAMSGARQFMAVGLAAAAVTAMFLWPPRFVMMTSFWYEPEEESEQSVEEARVDQRLVFEQSSRIDARIAAMAPRVDGQPNVFFLGFAGYGPQRVFAQEIELAATTIASRYQAEGRSLQLVNDARDGSRHPFATPDALRHALMGLASRMDTDEDVLFLSISSHGSEDAEISVESDYGYWPDLQAGDLAAMLRESGIRWKIIVISACYSGSFIDSLKDEGTIILTAADADRTSFGCSDKSELTYFGKAFYQDSLPGAATLRDAFMGARAEIGAREQKEGLEGSDPQGFFGKDITAKLASIENAAKP